MSHSPASKVVKPAAADDWDLSGALKTFGIPLGALAVCGLGAMYLTKRMTDLETHVSAIQRNEVRHLTETDVRMIVQQMSKDGLMGPNASTLQAHAQQQQRLLEQQQRLQQQVDQLQAAWGHSKSTLGESMQAPNIEGSDGEMPAQMPPPVDVSSAPWNKNL